MPREVRKNKQLVSHHIKGDCLRACLTSILNIENNPKYIKVDGKSDWFLHYYKFLSDMGLFMNFETKAMWRNGYWIASVKSKNFKEATHAIVMLGNEVYFDPSLGKRYKAGRSLLGKKIVLGCHYLEVVDSTKLHRLTYLQRQDNPNLYEQ